MSVVQGLLGDKDKASNYSVRPCFPRCLSCIGHRTLPENTLTNGRSSLPQARASTSSSTIRTTTRGGSRTTCGLTSTSSLDCFPTRPTRNRRRGTRRFSKHTASRSTLGVCTSPGRVSRLVNHVYHPGTPKPGRRLTGRSALSVVCVDYADAGHKQILTAGTVTDKETRDFLVSSVVKYAKDGKNSMPLSDWYDASTGTKNGFQARPVVGGHFALVRGHTMQDRSE
jgi:hypothetical protein